MENQKEILYTQSNIQNSSEETNQNNSPFSFEEIPKTGLRLVGMGENKYFIVFGEHRLTDVHTKEELMEMVLERNWNLMGAMICAICEKIIAKKFTNL